MIANVSILLCSSLCVFYLGLNVFALLRADAMIFPAPPSSYSEGDPIFMLEADTGEQIATDFLAASGEDSGALLIYSHGNGEDIGELRPFLKSFTEQGISVLAYDYPGYGQSSGQASEAGCYAAIEAVYRHATTELGFSSKQIILYGSSLGSGPSVWLATREAVGGLILKGAFTSTFRVLTRIKMLPWDRFDNLKRLPDVDCPVLLIHGVEDLTVPFSHALKNWAVISAPKQKLFVDEAGHNGIIEQAGQAYWDQVIPFILENSP